MLITFAALPTRLQSTTVGLEALNEEYQQEGDKIAILWITKGILRIRANIRWT